MAFNNKTGLSFEWSDQPVKHLNMPFKLLETKEEFLEAIKDANLEDVVGIFRLVEPTTYQPMAAFVVTTHHHNPNIDTFDCYVASLEIISDAKTIIAEETKKE